MRAPPRLDPAPSVVRDSFTSFTYTHGILATVIASQSALFQDTIRPIIGWGGARLPFLGKNRVNGNLAPFIHCPESVVKNDTTCRGLRSCWEGANSTVTLVSDNPITTCFVCKQTQILLWLSWDLSMAHIVSNIELGGLTWGLLYVPIMCMHWGPRRGLRSTSGDRTSG